MGSLVDIRGTYGDTQKYVGKIQSRICQELVSKGKTFQDLADHLGCDISQVENNLGGKLPMSLPALHTYSMALDLRMEIQFKEDKPKKVKK